MLDEPSDSTEVAGLSLDEVVVLVEDGGRSKISIRKKNSRSRTNYVYEREIIGAQVQRIEKFDNDHFPHNVIAPGFHFCKHDLRNMAISDTDGFFDFDNDDLLRHWCFWCF